MMETEFLRYTSEAPTLTGKRVSGHAIVYDRMSRTLADRGKPYREIIKPGAIKLYENINVLWMHDKLNILASKQGGTATFTLDDKGLLVDAELPDSAEREREGVVRGDVKAFSFRFAVNPGGEKWRGDVLELSDITVKEVSLVHDAAYPDAVIEKVRSIEQPTIRELYLILHSKK
jgi:HK97 family phage prohead protease